MTLKNKKLASAALAGLLATTVIIASDSFAAAKEGKSGCHGKDSSKMDKSSCKRTCREFLKNNKKTDKRGN